MAKNILVLTTIYPSPDIKISNTTNVVHYFACEWVKMGYNVHVVFNYPIYLRIFHCIAGFMRNYLASKFNTAVTAIYTNKDYKFELDGVKVIRMPLFKPFPHFKVPHRNIDKQIDKIVDYCRNEEFVPDIIVAHNFYPHIEIVNKLKIRFYHKVKTCVVVHKQNFKMLRYIPEYKRQIDDINIWGFRSIPLQKEFENFVGKVNKSFICYSGIPVSFLEKNEKKIFTEAISKYIYIGSFIRRKHPDKLLDAIKISNLKNFHIDYIGDGILKKKLKKKVSNEKWDENVVFHGFIPRELIPNFLKNSECFCMISEDETFGLVYLEAMSKGLITIASKNEGMEGIIINGINGFLCNAGDSKELAGIIKHIQNMSIEELNYMSEKARDTALKFSDKIAAEMYIKNVMNS